MPSTRPVASGDGEEAAAMAVSEAVAVGSSALELSPRPRSSGETVPLTHLCSEGAGRDCREGACTPNDASRSGSKTVLDKARCRNRPRSALPGRLGLLLAGFGGRRASIARLPPLHEASCLGRTRGPGSAAVGRSPQDRTMAASAKGGTHATASSRPFRQQVTPEGARSGVKGHQRSHHSSRL